MKRFISMLLALALCISVLGGMSIAGAEDVATERVYTIKAPSELTADIWDSTLKDGNLQSSVIPLIGYGNHGFKYWIADENTYNGAKKYVRALQFSATYLRIYSGYADESKTPPINDTHSATGMRIALALEKPSAVASFYKIVVKPSSGTASAAELYTSKLDESKRTVEHVFSVAAKNGTTYPFVGSTARDITELIYNNGTDDHVMGFFTGVGKNMQLGTITLTPVDATSIHLTFDEANLLKGEKKSARTYANLADKSQVFVTDSYVTYESSDDSVATIAEDGTITAIGPGTAKITATIGSFSDTAIVNVGKRVYSLIKPTLAAADWDSALTARYVQASIIPLKGYGSHEYKYWDADDASVINQSTNQRTLQYWTGGLRVWSYDVRGDESFTNPNGAKLAIALKTPRKGFYKINHTSGASDKAKGLFYMYMTEISAEDEAAESRIQVEEFLTEENLVKRSEVSNTGEHAYNKIIAPTGDSNLIWAVHINSEAQFSMTKLTLTELDVTAIDLTADATELEIGGKAALTTSANGSPIAHSFVTYTTEDTDIVSIAADGTVTALAAGDATIKATANGLSDTVEISVAEPTVEPEAPGEAADAKVSIYVAAENGGTVTSGDITVGSVNEAEIGKKVTVKAQDSETLKFSYWRNAAGKFVSSSATYSFTANTNTSLVAVFDKAEESSESVKVMFYNENKSLITSKDVEKATTFASAKNGVATNMTGYVFREWSIGDDAIINSLTRAVALYDVKNTTYSAYIFDGDESTPAYTTSGRYEDTVTYTAKGDNFSHWVVKDGSGRIASYDKTISFRLWATVALEAVYADASEPVPTIILDEEDGAYFITYSVPAGYEKVSAGIVFSKTGVPTVNNCFSRATAESTAATGQFTALPAEGEAVARGYLMFEKNGEIRVIYAD